MVRTLVFLMASLLSFQVAADEIPGSKFGFGNWEGAAWYDETSGDFSFCAISASYRSGDFLHFSVHADASISLAVTSSALNVPIGTEFPVTVSVDRRQPFYGRATIVADQMAALNIQDFERALVSFKKGYTMVIEGAGRRGVYDLTGTFRALDRAVQCTREYLYFKASFSGGSGKFSSSTSNAAVDPAVLYGLASQIIGDFGINDAHFRTAQELSASNISEAVAWDSDSTGISAIVLMFQVEPGTNLKSLDAAHSKVLAEDCNGDFASSAMSVAEDESARQLRVICNDENESYSAYLTKVMVGDHMLISHIIFNHRESIPNGSDGSEAASRATLRAAALYMD